MKVECRSSGGADRFGVVNGRGCQGVLVRGIDDFFPQRVMRSDKRAREQERAWLSWGGLPRLTAVPREARRQCPCG